MSRVPFIAGNWKLNMGPAAAGALAGFVSELTSSREDVEVAIFPTTLAVPSVIKALENSGISTGIQDISASDSGAFTGCNSAVMAREAGCTMTLIGHSERRTLFGETDESVNAKIITAMKAGLIPIVCIGETLAQRQAGDVTTVLTKQLRGALKGLTADQVSTLTLAYEPVWAIGTGQTATPDQAQEAHACIRSWMQESYPSFVADSVRIQYGGSVKPANASELLSMPDIDGALVGGASLNAHSFAAIVAAAK